MLERELLQEQLQQARDREAAAFQRERAATRREAQALEREIAAEEKVLAAADREQTTLELADQAKRAAAVVKAQETALAELAAATAKKEEWLAAHEAEEVAWLQELQKWEEAVEEELAAGSRRLREREAALQEREAKVEELLAERSASIDQITRWVGAVNPLLDALGANPIRVTEAPSPLGAALQVLDSTAERLRDVEASIQDLLETEGRAVARDGGVHPHQHSEPRPRHPTDPCAGRTPPGNGSRRARRSPGGGRHGRGTHPMPPRTCREWGCRQTVVLVSFCCFFCNITFVM
jgi:hypothetical protein